MSVRLFLNETDPGAVGDPGAAPADPAAPDQAADEQQPFQITQDQWDQQQQILEQSQQQIAYLQQFAPPPQQFQQQQQPEYGPPDPFADDFQQQLDQYIEQRLAPYAGVAQTFQEREGEQLAQDIIADDISKNGDFVEPDAAKDNIEQLAQGYYAANLPPGASPQQAAQVAEQAYYHGIQQTRAYEQRIGDLAVERFKNQLAGLPNGRRELGTDSAAAQTFPIPGGGTEMDLVRRYTGGG